MVVGELRPALFGQTVGLVDGGVDVDGERLLTRAGTGRPGPTQQFARHHVELTGMAPGEAAQETSRASTAPAPRGRARLGVAPARRASASSIAVTAGQRRMDQGHGLVSHVGPARCIPEVHMLVEQLQQTEVLGQRGRQHRARRWPPDGRRRRSPQRGRGCGKIASKSAFLVWVGRCQQPPFSLSRKAFSRIRGVLRRSEIRWIRA